jgi:UDP-N-acetylglucosamine--N-acetylmuramyl-(pentapeptide) pyrophosphoryl-undecaprenol N-acetylglucosamine transferase
MELGTEKNKTVLLVGGGSGGHLTPLIAVAAALKSLDVNTRVIQIGQKGEDLAEVTEHTAIDKTYEVTAGKFRRYYGESFLSHLLDVKTVALNIRDFFRFIAGTVQAYFLLRKLNPDVIFLKGGFVSVPVGLAARLRRVPYITHDSDAIPGLANRLTAKHAVYNTTALPIKEYPYEQSKTLQVGIPIQPAFTKVSETEKASAKKQLNIATDAPVLFSVGGGLGAQKLNETLVEASKNILDAVKNLQIIHLTGKKLYSSTVAQYEKLLTAAQMKQVQVIDFSTTLYELSAAADCILTRAGATNIAEFAAQAKPCIVMPAPQLTGGQQLHNARVLARYNAAVVVEEGDSSALELEVIKILSNRQHSEGLSKNIHGLARYDAAHEVALLLTKIAEE